MVPWRTHPGFGFYYFKNCSENSECDRDGYTCATIQRKAEIVQACMPDPVVYLEISPHYEPADFCARPQD